MTYQESIINATESAISNLFRSTRTVPADKLEWSPLEQGRTVLDMLQECASTPNWFIPMLVERKSPEWSPEDMAKGRAARKQWKTVDECEKACRDNSAKLYAAIRGVPEADLGVEIEMPFRKGMMMSLSDIMAMHYWNLVYHLGQINYIQTLYGDKEMH